MGGLETRPLGLVPVQGACFPMAASLTCRVLRSNKSMKHPILPHSRSSLCRTRHQSLFGSRPSTASHSSGRHDHRADRLYRNLPPAPLPSDSLMEDSLVPLALRPAHVHTTGAHRARLVHAPHPLEEPITINYYCMVPGSSPSFKNQKLDRYPPSGSTSASTPSPRFSFALHSRSIKVLCYL